MVACRVWTSVQSEQPDLESRCVMTRRDRQWDTAAFDMSPVRCHVFYFDVYDRLGRCSTSTYDIICANEILPNENSVRCDSGMQGSGREISAVTKRKVTEGQTWHYDMETWRVDDYDAQMISGSRKGHIQVSYIIP